MVTINAHIGKDTYKTLLRTSVNELVADEPLSDGGKEEGFSPSELLSSALGACTCITLRMYADRKKFPLDSIDVVVTLEKNPNSETTLMGREITLHGDLSEDERSRLLQIANLCPIHKILSNPVQISTTLK